MSEVQSTIADEVEYRLVPKFPAYRVGDDGSFWSRWKRVRNKTGWGSHVEIGSEWNRIAPHTDRNGYQCVGLYRDGIVLTRKIHQLVALVFIGEREDGMQVCHDDGNPKNNTLSNLRYGTQEENSADKVRHGTLYGGERHHKTKVIEQQVREIRRAYAAGGISLKELAAQYGVTFGQIGGIVKLRSWKHIV